MRDHPSLQRLETDRKWTQSDTDSYPFIKRYLNNISILIQKKYKLRR